MKIARIADDGVIVPRNKIVYKNKNGLAREIHVENSSQWLKAGYLVCSMNLETDVIAVQEYLDDIKILFSGMQYKSFRINMYQSPSSVGIPIHFDILNSCIFQLKGAKKWLVSEAPAFSGLLPANFFPPPDKQIVDYFGTELHIPSKSELIEITLEEGDILRLPAGVWHTTETVEGSFSSSLTIGLIK